MSGGSYNYLCFRDESDIFTRLGDLQAMADRLDEVCPEAAAETRALFAGPRSLYAELGDRLGRLADLWKAVEWRDSSDWGDNQLAQAVAEFRAQGPALDALAGEVERLREIQRLAESASQALAEASRLAVRPWGGAQ